MVILIEMNCVTVRALVFSNFELKLSRSIYELKSIGYGPKLVI